MNEPHSKKRFTEDLAEIIKKANLRSYTLSPQDVFALGYMCAKYDVSSLLDMKMLLLKRVEDTKTDDLGLYDTIGETLIDLKNN